MAIYTEDTPDAMSFVLAAASFSELLDQIEFLNDIGRQDERIASRVREAKTSMRATRERTKHTRARVVATTRVIESRTAEQRAVRDRLLASRNELATVRSLKRDALGAVQEDRASFIHEVDGLQQQSAALGARIQAAQSAAASSPARRLRPQRRPRAASSGP